MAADIGVAREIIRALHEAGAAAGLLGGLAVAELCPSAASGGPFAREYKDIDLATVSPHGPVVAKTLDKMGLVADRSFNLLHGHERLYFWHEPGQFQVDVFVDRFRLCHVLPLHEAVGLTPTIEAGMLLMTKLQIVQVNEKDLMDSAALLLDRYPDDMNLKRIDQMIGEDWGLWRTASETLARVADYGADRGTEGRAVGERARDLRARWDQVPKTLKWKMRARIGDRVRWYEEPEEEAH